MHTVSKIFVFMFRSATEATREATLAILDGKTTNVKELLSKCSAQHGQLVKEASMGLSS